MSLEIKKLTSNENLHVCGMSLIPMVTDNEILWTQHLKNLEQQKLPCGDTAYFRLELTLIRSDYPKWQCLTLITVVFYKFLQPLHNINKGLHTNE